MNCVNSGEKAVFNLVDIIDFKWLMAHEGHHIHVERIQSDREYASACIAKASVSSVAALRDAARRLAPLLSIPN